jgi:hypothetical protein
MIEFGKYLNYLFIRYFPVAMSAQSAAFLIYYLFISNNTSLEDMKEALVASLVMSTGAWVLLFMAEENLRRLVSAVTQMVNSINETLAESEDEDHHQV